MPRHGTARLIVHFRGPTLANCVPPMRRALAELGRTHKSIVFSSVIEEESPLAGA